MTDWPNLPPLPLFISTFTRWGCMEAQAVAAVPLSRTWPVANTAYYMPVLLPWPYPVARVWWVNGSSVTSVNMDFGIYTASGVRIYSTGSTAQSGASAVQYVTPTEFLLAPGRYYFALACSSTTTNRGGQGTVSTVAALRLGGVLQEASALPLPATMTPAAVTNALYPYCGITRAASGF